MKKYLTSNAITDNKEAAEFDLLAGAEKFTIMVREKKDSDRLTISYKEFAYPQFISEDAFSEELKEKIEKAFEYECKGKAILISYSAAEVLRINQIISDNKKEYNL